MEEWKAEMYDRFGQEAYTKQYYQNYLAHHGILGQKWGVRRFQNADGTLTAEGRARYGVGDRGEGAKTLSTAYGRFNSRQKRTAIGAKIKANAALYGGGIAGGVPGLLIGNGGAAMVGSSIGSMAGYGVADTVLKRASAKMNKRRLDDNDVKNNKIVIEEGQEFKRTSTKEREDNNERLYVSSSLSKFDVDYYEKEWPKYLKKISERDDTKVYQNTYKVTNSLVAPSLEERKKTAQAIVNANKKMREEFAKTYAMDQMRLRQNILSAKDLNDLLKKQDRQYKERRDALIEMGKKNGIDSKRLAEGKKMLNNSMKVSREQTMEYYNSLVKKLSEADSIDMNANDNFKKFTASIPTSPKLMNTYVKELKKQGYDAVYDDNSNGEAPFIIFDQKNLRQTGSRRIA